MLTLYYKPSCPFSQRVLGEAEALNITLDLRNVGGDEVLVEELIARGGKKQTPYFVDSDRDVEMYESADIITYLQTHFGESSREKEFSGVRVHKSDEACDTCQ